MICPVILAGGKGIRLWPISRESSPKPYVHALPGEETLLQTTLRRAGALASTQPATIICNSEHDFLVRAQALAVMPQDVRLILEPEGRNTAPAICVGALVQQSEGNDAPMLVLPADHVIRDMTAFGKAVQAGAELAANGYLATFAIKPTFAATGYGYIKLGTPIDRARGLYRIGSFVEKPKADVAQRFLESGDYAWNSGMFMFKPSTILKAFELLDPATLAACRAALVKSRPGETVKLDKAAFASAPSNSIDYAIMEKASNTATVVADFDWSDVGDWRSVWSISAHDANDNAVFGNIELVGSSNSLLMSEGPLVVGIGLKDMIVVASKDAIVVSTKDSSQDVKIAVEQLKSRHCPEAIGGKKVLRPWGSYEQLHIGQGFQVKELTVLPGAKLSLQRHKFRGEHWVCIAGEGFAVRNAERIPLAVGRAVDIPLGSIHRLENSGSDILRIIETQIGSYTGEDDIERFEDVYGRV